MTAQDRRRTDAALLGEMSATICDCRNPYIRFRGKWERRGSLLGVWAAARGRLSAWAHLEEGGGIIKIFATIICSKQYAHSNLASLDLGWLSPRQCLSDSVLA